jgi:hypothetical protein
MLYVYIQVLMKIIIFRNINIPFFFINTKLFKYRLYYRELNVSWVRYSV